MIARAFWRLAAVQALAQCACTPTDDSVGVVIGDAHGELCVAGPTLKRRPESAPVTVLDGMHEPSTGSAWPLLRRDQYVSLQGQGYLNLRWQIEYALSAGLVTPPVFSGISGLFLRVGGGGGKNLADPRPGTSGTWMGNAEEGISYMAEGVPTPWQNEFYYLDGQVTLTHAETDGLYNVTVSAQTYEDLSSADWGVYDPGVVCDPE